VGRAPLGSVVLAAAAAGVLTFTETGTWRDEQGGESWSSVEEGGKGDIQAFI
jgi:hypothetical protein